MGRRYDWRQEWGGGMIRGRTGEEIRLGEGLGRRYD